MKAVLTFFACILFIQSAFSQIQTYRLLDYSNLKTKLTGNSSPSSVKMYDIAIDQRRGLAYTTPIMNEHIAQIDIINKSYLKSVSYPYATSFTISYVYVNPPNGYILCGNTDASPSVIYLVNPQTSALVGSYTYNSSQGGVSFDTLRNRIFIGDGNKIKILNGTNFTLLDSINVGFTVSSMVFDSLGTKVYVSSRNLVGSYPQLKVFNCVSPFNTLRILPIITSTVCGIVAADSSRNRFIMANPDTMFAVSMSTGLITMTKKLGSDVTGFEYDKRTGKGYFMNSTGYDQQGQGGAWSKMYILDFNTGVLDSAKRGDKTYKALVYEAGNKLVWPDMHSGYIEIMNMATNVIDSVHIGVTLDEMDISPDNNSLFIACRLGGSDIVKYNINTFAATKSKAGNWSCVVRTDSALNKVFVLNHMASTISVINPATNTVTATITLPINEGRNDAIAVMCYDKFLQKIFVSFPEFGNIVKINAVTNAVESTTPIPGFTFNPDAGGIGMLQLIIAPDFSKLFCLDKNARRLKVFNTSTMAVDSFAVAAQWNDTMSAFEENCMYYDSVSNRLFVGNIIVNAANNAILGKITGLGKVVGINQAKNKMYGFIISDDSLRMSEHSTSSPYSRTALRVLYKKRFTGPIYYYDKIRNDLFITELQLGVLRHYDLDSTVNFITNINENGALPKSYSLKQNYPNPFNPSTRISFEIPRSEFVNITVYDLSGKIVQELVNSEMKAGDYTFEFNAANLSTGVYFYRIRAGDFSETKKMMLVK
ncbi:MAG: T9SS type A sorting domain-containing protein [Bacteroidetes bacterium]|nr:T9SS type A sorting domain-containing protein [Bacteroidota bacterium]